MLRNHHIAQSVKIHLTEVGLVHLGEYDSTTTRKNDSARGQLKQGDDGTTKQNSSYRQHETPTPTGSTQNNLYLNTFKLAGVPTLKGFNSNS